MVAKLISMVGSDQMELAEAMTALTAEALEAQRGAEDLEREELTVDQGDGSAMMRAAAGRDGSCDARTHTGPAEHDADVIHSETASDLNRGRVDA